MKKLLSKKSRIISIILLVCLILGATFFVALNNITIHVNMYYNGEKIYSYDQKIARKIVEPETRDAPIGFKYSYWHEIDKTEPFNFDSRVFNDIDLYCEQIIDNLELPTMEINYKDSIIKKDEYIDASIKIIDNKIASNNLEETNILIKGRGNTTWNVPDKKPYHIKFPLETSLFGYEKQKSWTLLANHFDKSLIRNYLAFDLSNLLPGIKYTSVYETFIDLYLNNQYVGVYQLCSQINNNLIEAKNDFDINGDNDYLIELNNNIAQLDLNKDITFAVNGMNYVITSPDNEAFIENKNIGISYLTNYLNKADNIISDLSYDYEEVKKYINTNSFVDSYIVDELFANNDCGWSSCYFYKKKNGALTKGPIWDFDISAGNINTNMGNQIETKPDTSLYASKVNIWYTKLLSRNEFVNDIKSRLKIYNESIASIIEKANPLNPSSIYQIYKNAFERNFVKYPIFDTKFWNTPDSILNIKTLQGQFEYLYNWLNKRFAYLKTVYK